MQRSIILTCLACVCLLGCSESSKEHIRELKRERIAKETTWVGKERLKIRYRKALHYVRNHRWDPIPRNRDTCLWLTPDTLRKESLEIRVVDYPLVEESYYLSDFLKYRLPNRWACEVYGEQPTSPDIGESNTFYVADSTTPSIHHPTETLGYLNDQKGEVTHAINDWQSRNRKSRVQVVKSILEDLPSDSSGGDLVIFEMPTGRAVTVQVLEDSYYSEFDAQWDSLSNDPSAMLRAAVAADIATVFFDKNDKIQSVWWGGWMR